MLTLRVTTNDILLVHVLEALNSEPWMASFTTSALREGLLPVKPPTVKIRQTTSDGSPAAAEIAPLCFADYFSHYHSDLRLDGVKVSEAYIQLLNHRVFFTLK